jgi:hypothetical protein
MGAVHDFVIVGDYPSGRQIVASALESVGFTLTYTPQGDLRAKRGGTLSTVLMGAAAADGIRSTVAVDFRLDPQKQLVARLTQRSAAAVLVGGPTSQDSMQSTSDVINAALISSGRLARSTLSGSQIPRRDSSVPQIATGVAGPLASRPDSPRPRRGGWIGLVAAAVFTMAAAVVTSFAFSAGTIETVTGMAWAVVCCGVPAAAIALWGVWEFPTRTYLQRALLAFIIWTLVAIAISAAFGRYETILHF